MEIAFSSSRIRQICENSIAGDRALGKAKADILRRRLADLRALDYVGDMVGQSLVQGGQLISIPLDGDAKLIFSANHNINPTLPSGSIDWPRVNRIKIMEITNE